MEESSSSNSSSSLSASGVAPETIVDASSAVIAEVTDSTAKDGDVEEGSGEADTDADDADEAQPDNNIDVTEVS